MNVIIRGIRNAFRNGIRSISIVVILGISIGLALSMLIAQQAVNAKIESVKSTIGNTIKLTPAGSQGFEGGGEPLTSEQIEKASAVEHVTGVVSIVGDRFTSETSSLESAIDLGSLGKRNQSGLGGGGPVINTVGPDGKAVQSSSPPIMATGTDDPQNSASFSGAEVNLTDGEWFDGKSSENVAVVGKTLAEKNNLQIGSTFTAHDEQVEVVGIYDAAGNKFVNNGLVMPLAALQNVSDQKDTITSATVTIDSIDNMDAVVSDIKAELGDSADVVSQQETAEQAVEPLETIKNITLFSLFSALIAGGTIILLTMIMIVRERRREIGVLKAIGASNLRVMTQFMTESVTLTMLGAFVGTAIGVLLANPLTDLLVSSSANSGGNTGSGGGRMMTGGPGGGGGMVAGPGGPGGMNFQNIDAVIGWDVLFYGLAAALLIAIAGSAAAAWLIGKIRPAEVMRAE